VKEWLVNDETQHGIGVSVPEQDGLGLMFVNLILAEIALLLGFNQFQSNFGQVFSLKQKMRVVAAQSKLLR
jgi:hypothetical protein